MADNNNKKKYAGGEAVTEAIKAIRKILGEVSSAGIEHEGNVITGGGQNIVSALFALDNELSKKSSIYRIDVVQVGDDKYIFNRSYDDIKDAYNAGYAIYVEDSAVDRISVYEDSVSISVRDSYTFTAGGTQTTYRTYDWNTLGELTIRENAVNLLTYGDGSKFLNDAGKYEEVPAIKEHARAPYNADGIMDCNEAIESGTYMIFPATINHPLESDDYGTLMMFKSNRNDVWMQIATSYKVGSATYIRSGNLRNGVMNIIRDWKQVIMGSDGLINANIVQRTDGEESLKIDYRGITYNNDSDEIYLGARLLGNNKFQPLIEHSYDSDFNATPLNIVKVINIEDGGGSYAIYPEWNHIYKLQDNIDYYSLTSLIIHNPINGASLEEYNGLKNKFHEEILIEFNCGVDDMTLTVPNNLVWADNEAPTFKVGYRYQLSINKYTDKDDNTVLMGVCVGFPIVL